MQVPIYTYKDGVVISTEFIEMEVPDAVRSTARRLFVERGQPGLDKLGDLLRARGIVINTEADIDAALTNLSGGANLTLSAANARAIVKMLLLCWLQLRGGL